MVNHSSESSPSVLTLELAQKIVDKHGVSGPDYATVVGITELQKASFSSTKGIRTHIVDLTPDLDQPASFSCFISVEWPLPTPTEEPTLPNTLQTIKRVISKIRSGTSIPIPDSKLDITQSLVPFNYLLSPPSRITSSNIISLADARKAHLIPPKLQAQIELQIGALLAQLHNVQNDWFGPFGESESDPQEPSYSWQDTFVLLLETVLDEHEKAGLDLPYQTIRLLLGKHIGMHLWSDVEVPSLVWFTGSEQDIFILHPSAPVPSKMNNGIVAILPNLAHTLWGDPLLETFFVPPLSQALREGYKESGGSAPLDNVDKPPPSKSAARPDIKRIWYTLLLTLFILQEQGADAVVEGLGHVLRLVHKTVDDLSRASGLPH